MCYKAVEKYYNFEGQEIINVCGYGYCKDLEEAQSLYSARVRIEEIKESDLKILLEGNRGIQ